MSRDTPRDAAVRLAFAFRLGAVGSIILGAFTLTTARLASLVALAVWTLATLFVLPTVYDYVVRDDTPVTAPEWLLREADQ